MTQITLSQYLQKKERLRLVERSARPRCRSCRNAEVTCYCNHIKAFSPTAKFVILIHRNEARRGVATGRMAHLCLRNSHLFEGTNFSRNEGVNNILKDPANYCVLLYPGFSAIDISREKLSFPVDKQLVVFLIDATWGQARRIKRLSRNLHGLPQICFTPTTPSIFTVRQQPRPDCYSTIEAVHYMIELLGSDSGRSHDNLLTVFKTMIDQQIFFENNIQVSRHQINKAIRQGLATPYPRASPE